MPIFDYECPVCKETSEYLVPDSDYQVHCFNPKCPGVDVIMTRLPGAPSFKIKGARATNSYGVKFEDTYGKSPVNDKETGCAFVSNRGFTAEHNFKEGE